MLKRIALVSFPLYLLDQATKLLVLRSLPLGGHHTVIDGFFEICHVHNTGMAWGLLKNRNLFFILFATAALGVLVYLARRGAFRDRPSMLGLLLLLPGILGNLTDRLAHGHVIDFLYFHLDRFDWPAFNVADSCITLAVACFLLAAFRPPPSREHAGGVQPG